MCIQRHQGPLHTRVSTNHLVKPVKILVDELLNHAENTPWVLFFFFFNQTGINAFGICKKKTNLA